jgi:hypothetical protein
MTTMMGLIINADLIQTGILTLHVYNQLARTKIQNKF